MEKEDVLTIVKVMVKEDEEMVAEEMAILKDVKTVEKEETKTEMMMELAEREEVIVEEVVMMDKVARHLQTREEEKVPLFRGEDQDEIERYAKEEKQVGMLIFRQKNNCC